MRLLLTCVLAFVYQFSMAQNLVPFLTKDGKYIYVQAGNMQPALREEYDMASFFSPDGAAVRQGEKWKLITAKGKVLGSDYDEAYEFRDGLARVLKDGKTGFINNKGEMVVPFKYDMAGDFSEGMAMVAIKNRYGFIDTKGKEVIPIIYEGVRNFSEGYAGVQTDGRWGYVDKAGKMVIKTEYLNAFDFSEGLAGVLLGDSWRFIDKQNKQAMTPMFNEVTAFSEGVCVVRNGPKWFVIDKTGKQIFEHNFLSMGSYHNGLAPVNNAQGKCGYIDMTGKEIIPLQYDGVTEFVKGFGYAFDKGQRFVIDKKGREFRQKGS